MITESTMKIENGNKVWRNKQGQLHRLDGPAFEHADGTKLQSHFTFVYYSIQATQPNLLDMDSTLLCNGE